VLAEGIAGNERIFADMMTKRARELGMTQSTFGNSNGLPDPANKMTVRELAKLARYVIQTYPEFYKLFGEREFTWNKIRQQNRNPLLLSLEGADGLKTGYTKDGGYGMVGSAVQNGTRLIVVVNGLDDPDDRTSEAKKMLEWGYRNFEARTLFAAEQPVPEGAPARTGWPVSSAARSDCPAQIPTRKLGLQCGAVRLASHRSSRAAGPPSVPDVG